jgi:hypothetical protein
MLFVHAVTAPARCCMPASILSVTSTLTDARAAEKDTDTVDIYECIWMHPWIDERDCCVARHRSPYFPETEIQLIFIDPLTCEMFAASLLPKLVQLHQVIIELPT